MIQFSRIESYSRNEIEAFLRQALEKFGVYEKIRKHPYTLIKPNLLTVSLNQAYVTTNPLIVEVLVELLKKHNTGRIVIGDGAAANYLEMDRVFEETGYRDIAKRHGIELASFNTGKSIAINGIRFHGVMRDKPYIFNVAKLKTHMLTGMTISVKNVYGLIPAKYKLLYHSQHPDSASFSEFVARVFNAANPQMNIVDGIFGMDRNGPSNGRPVKPGILAASQNGFALDHFLCDFTGHDMSQFRYLKYAVHKGYYDGHYTISPHSFDVFSYELPTTNRFEGILKFARNRLIKKMSTAYPEVKKDECRKCMNCYNICPADAIIIKDKIPYVRRRKCLACYCCVEACPYDCILTKPSTLEWIAHV